MQDKRDIRTNGRVKMNKNWIEQLEFTWGELNNFIPSSEYCNSLANATVDRDSTAYFMTEMTQKEFKKRVKHLEKSQHEFNRIKK